jgi:hypothetical protein
MRAGCKLEAGGASHIETQSSYKERFDQALCVLLLPACRPPRPCSCRPRVGCGGGGPCNCWPHCSRWWAQVREDVTQDGQDAAHHGLLSGGVSADAGGRLVLLSESERALRVHTVTELEILHACLMVSGQGVQVLCAAPLANLSCKALSQHATHVATTLAQ